MWFFTKYRQAVEDAAKYKSLYEELNNILPSGKYTRLIDIENKIQQDSAKLSDIQKAIADRQNDIAKADSEFKTVHSKLIEAQGKYIIQQAGIFEPMFKYDDPKSYRDAITNNLKQQKYMIKQYTAMNFPAMGQFVVNDLDWADSTDVMAKIHTTVLTAYNLSCDKYIKKINLTNLQAVKDSIDDLYHDYNNKFKELSISINFDYHRLKLEQCDLMYSLKVREQEIKIEKQHQADILREQKAIAKELEAAKAKLVKEHKHYEQQLAKAPEEKVAEIQAKLDEIDEQIAQNDYRYANQKAGYLYVISNDDMKDGMVKIGVTRRLDPMDRVKELSNASHSFMFKVHGMIFSEDCFALETAMHQHFDDRRVNKINKHKEFFYADLDEVENILNNKFNMNVQLDRNAVNSDYILSTEEDDDDDNY